MSHCFQKTRIYSYFRRHRNDFEVPEHKNGYFEKSPKYTTVSIFNKLPPSFRILPPSVLINKIKKILLEDAFYRLEDSFDFSFNVIC